MRSNPPSEITGIKSKGCEEWDDEEIYQARVDFEDWCMQQESQDLELYIQQRKFSLEIANRIREQVALEEHLFSARPNQLLVDSFNEFELQGTRIGDYRLIRQLGQGGMGTVWLAQQEERVKRHVAIKLIKPGFDSKEFVRRFSVERQALAVMSHHHIARVLDAGLTSAGRPYFVMEYIPGISIVKYCETNHLSTESRLRLFLQLCGAIQHAHQKGVIHRDIKPSNILVVDNDGERIAKVIDFGLAKAFDAEQNEFASITQERMMIGSPLWMSPEQIGGPFGLSQQKADTRSDVYSLGVVLYQLLTGTTPIRYESYLALEFDQLAKRIREEIPPPPSARIRRQSGVDADSVTQALPQGDLDWIVLKALEKEPDRRYDGVASFAKDIQCYLDQEPIQARRPSRRYQIQMLLKKHRTVASFVTAIITLLMVGTTISTALAIWALKERATAVKLQKQAEKTSEDLRTESELFQGPLADPFESAFALFHAPPNHDVSRFISKVNNTNYSEAPRSEAVARQIVGQLAFRAGNLHASREQFEQAYFLFTQPDSRNPDRSNNCLLYLGKIAFLLEDYSKSIELFQQLVDANSTEVGSTQLWNLGNSIRLAASYQKKGNTEKAIELCEEVCRLIDLHYKDEDRFWILAHSTLAKIFLETNQMDQADYIAQKVKNRLETTRLAHVPASELECLYCLVAVNEALNRDEESIELLQRAIGISHSHFSNDHELSVDLLVSLARHLDRIGNKMEALQEFQSAVLKSERFLGASHPKTVAAKSELKMFAINNPDLIIQHTTTSETTPSWENVQPPKAIDYFEDLIAECQQNLGVLYLKTSRPSEAVSLLQESVAYFENENGVNSFKAIDAKRKLVSALFSAGEHQEAIRLGDEILEHFDQFNQETDQGHIDFRREMSHFQFEIGNQQKAIQLAQKNLDHYRAQLKPDHKPTQESLYSLRSLYLQSGQHEQAIQLQKSYCEQFVEEFGESNSDTIFELKNYATALQLAGQTDEATKHFKKVLNLCNEHLGRSNHNSIIYAGYVQNHLMANEKFQQAVPVIRDWLSVIEPGSREYFNRRGWALVSLADYHASVGEYDSAKTIIGEVQDLMKSAPAHGQKPSRREIARLKIIQGLCLAHDGKFDEAIELATTSFRSLRKEKTCVNWPYHRWYLLRGIDRLIEIHELAGDKAEADRWRKERITTQKYLADTLHTIKIR